MTSLLLAAALLAAAPPAPGASPSRALAKGNLAALISDSDYPVEALQANEQGTVGFRLDIGTDGLVAGCTVTQSSGSAVLDSTTCRILRERARFVPARDSKGRAVTDRVTSRITWRIVTGAEPSPELDAAMQVWMNCLGPRFADPARPVSALAAEAFRACRAEEDKLVAAIAGPDPAPGTMEDLRASLREQITGVAEAARRQTQL